MSGSLFFLLAGAPVIAALGVAMIFRKPGVSLVALLLGSGTLLLDTGRYLTPFGRRLFWAIILCWFVIVLSLWANG